MKPNGTTINSTYDKITLQQTLPKISLSKLTGDFTEYKSFIDNINSIVNQLSGKAVNCIAGLQPSNDNYEIALNLLKDRYDHLKLIVCNTFLI